MKKSILIKIILSIAVFIIGLFIIGKCSETKAYHLNSYGNVVSDNIYAPRSTTFNSGTYINNNGTYTIVNGSSEEFGIFSQSMCLEPATYTFKLFGYDSNNIIGLWNGINNTYYTTDTYVFNVQTYTCGAFNIDIENNTTIVISPMLVKGENVPDTYEPYGTFYSNSNVDDLYQTNEDGNLVSSNILPNPINSSNTSCGTTFNYDNGTYTYSYNGTSNSENCVFAYLDYNFYLEPNTTYTLWVSEPIDYRLNIGKVNEYDITNIMPGNKYVTFITNEVNLYVDAIMITNWGIGNVNASKDFKMMLLKGSFVPDEYIPNSTWYSKENVGNIPGSLKVNSILVNNSMDIIDKVKYIDSGYYFNDDLWHELENIGYLSNDVSITFNFANELTFKSEYTMICKNSIGCNIWIYKDNTLIYYLDNSSTTTIINLANDNNYNTLTFNKVIIDVSNYDSRLSHFGFSDNRYQVGYEIGYDSGYDVGFANAILNTDNKVYEQGYSDGNAAGYQQGMADKGGLMAFIPSTLGAVVGNAMPILTYEVYGISIMNIIGLIALVGIAIIVVKFAVGG